MSTPVVCPKCGKPVPVGSPGGICPACLIQAGLSSSWVDLGTKTHHSPAGIDGGFVPPHIEQLSALFPQLELIRVLGHGGMGAVYLARQKSLDRLVALKIIRPESAGTLGFAERFSREARALARLNHPGIVGVHDFGSVALLSSTIPAQATGNDSLDTPSLFFLLMEYVDGANVRQLIAGKNLSPREALAIVPQICEALQFAHDIGVVHRDIKPENILLDQRGRVKIADFGLAKLTAADADEHSLTGTHQIMGTPRYMAPEQLEQSRTIDHRVDIYSLGVVFYEMLTGEIPMGMFDPPSKKVLVDVRLDKVVLRSLAREPARRYQQVSEIKTDVESVVNQPNAPKQAAQADLGLQQSAIAKLKSRISSSAATAWIWYLQLATCLLGMLASIFPLCQYSGHFWGLETYAMKDGSSEMMSVMPNSPAWNAGFRPGDFIIAPEGWNNAESALYELKHNIRNKTPFQVRRGEEMVTVLAETVESRLDAVGYSSAWFPFAGVSFLSVGLFVFVSASKTASRSWQSKLVVIAGCALVIGCVIGSIVSVRFVVWTHPDLPTNRWVNEFDSQTPFIFQASLALTVLAAFGMQRRQPANKAVAQPVDVGAIVANPAAALTIVAWLAIPALLITALLLLFVPVFLDASGF